MVRDPALSALIGDRYATAGDGVRLHYVEAGPAGGEVVVLLHGFPEDWYSWRHQLPALAGAGYRVIAPDMRGVGDSERPRQVSAYTLDRLTDDVVAILRSAGSERATVIGHDWGAAIAWSLAAREPALATRLIVMNGPHPGRFLRALRDPRQAMRSLYLLAFQLPWLPERLLTARDGAALVRALTRGSAPGAFSASDLAYYRARWRRPGAVTGALAPYRALPRQLRATRAAARLAVSAHVLVIWGDRDPYLRRALADPGPASAPNLRIERISAAGHFVQADAPEEVNARVLAFMRQERGG